MVKLKPAGRDSHAYGIFALGGILNGRDCGVFGHDKELEFLEVVLEFRHKWVQKCMGYSSHINILQLRPQKGNAAASDDASGESGQNP